MRKFILTAILFFTVNAANLANAAEIDRVFYFGNPDISYPLVVVEKNDAAIKINSVIREEVKRFLTHIEKIKTEGNFSTSNVDIDYQIPCNHENGILSVILTEYVNFEGAAHPVTLRFAFNFNSDSGERITADTLTEIAKKPTDYTPADITKKLKAFSAKNNLPLYSEFTEVTAVPENFYFDDNLHVHFIFQQYEVAPYAAGIIDLDADATY